MKNKVQSDLEKSLIEGMNEALDYAKGEAANVSVKRVRRESFAPVPEIFGHDVVKLRAELHLSQPRLADFLDIDVSTVRRWEQKDQKITGSSARLLQILMMERERTLKLFNLVIG